MTEYITFDQLREELSKNARGTEQKRDLVEVVRCRDCKQHYRMWGDRLLCAITHRRVKPDGFCAWGERV